MGNCHSSEARRCGLRQSASSRPHRAVGTGSHTLHGMGIFHLATITPTKEEVISGWLPSQPWGTTGDVEVVGSFRFDDPDGRVGMEDHIVRVGDALFQVPLTYRDEPSPHGDDGFITEMHHSALGTRWVYDGLRDPTFVMSLAGVSLTGQGETLGMAQVEGRWYISPASVRIQGGGWTRLPVAVDGFELRSDDGPTATLRNDRFELTVHRHVAPGAQPAMGLTARWKGHDPVLLAEIRDHTAGT